MRLAWLIRGVATAALLSAGCFGSDDGGGGSGGSPDGGVAEDGGGASGAGGAGAGGSGGSAGDGSGGSGGSAGDGSGGSAGDGSGGSGGGSGAGSGGQGGGDGPTLDEIPAMLVDALCVEVLDCLGAATLEQYFGDQSCADRFLAGVEDGDFSLVEAAVDAGRAIYHPDQVEACLGSFAGLGCGFSTMRILRQDACADVFEGTVELGGACSVDEECIGVAFCAGDSCPGTCSELLAAGGACDDDDQCESGLTCGDDGCFAPAALGAACGGGVAPACDEGLICAGDDEDTAQAGTCKNVDDVFVNGDGEGCDFDTLTLCEQGLSCAVVLDTGGQPASLTCGSGVGSGEACTFGVPSQCPAGEYCTADPTQSQWTGDCVPYPAEGEPCVMTPGAGTGCSAGLHCDVDQRCHGIGRIGDTCVSDDGCAGGYCNGSTCARPEACTP